MFLSKANTGILKRGEIKMWMWLCEEGERYLGFQNKVEMREIRRNIVRKKRCSENSLYGYGSESSRGSEEG